MSDILVTRGLYFGTDVIMICDTECGKAWGINNRPRLWVQDESQTVYPNEAYHDIEQNPAVDTRSPFEIDNYAYLADSELGDAPLDTGIYEGGDAKPFKPEKHNKWCCRECERCTMIALRDLPIGESEALHDQSRRVYNMPQKKEGQS